VHAEQPYKPLVGTDEVGDVLEFERFGVVQDLLEIFFHASVTSASFDLLEIFDWHPNVHRD
jgi:hypothetical protein